jgi:adenine-specific DNA-methyltransferase
MAKKPPSKLTVEALKHDEATRKNIPTAEYQSVMQKEEQSPIRLAYERRNRDLDPQLVWRGKDEKDWSDLVVYAPPLYIQEKVHPKVLIDDLMKAVESGRFSVDSRDKTNHSSLATKHLREAQIDLFADFNGLPTEGARTEFYQHDANWSNRMILGDSLQVMASLAEREGLRGKVQCIYLDPPYGIKFNSNFQWSTTSRDVKDGNTEHITREPEQVKAFRDTWRDGIHSYLTYLRDRLTVARDLLTESGSIFLQIGDENVHRVRAVMDEVFGEENFIGLILFKKTGGLTTNFLSSIGDYLLWYGKSKPATKFRSLYLQKTPGGAGATQFKYELLDEGSIAEVGFERVNQLPPDRAISHDNITSQGNVPYEYVHRGKSYVKGYKPSPKNLARVDRAGRFIALGQTPRYIRKLSDFGVFAINELWDDLSISGFADPKVYVVQTATAAVQRCILMTTDPGDLVLDPTCGSGTTAYVAEQWGRRWITIDTSRVALALARVRIMGARYQYYLIADSRDGQVKEGEITRSAPSSAPTRGDIRQGFVYERVPHITLKSIANNAEIDVIWEKYEQRLAPLREELSVKSGEQKTLEEWEIPREMPKNYPLATQSLFTAFWEQRIDRQKEIDASIAAKAEFEYLYDKPYEDKKKVRVAGPFTVESLSPHRVLAVGADDELIDTVAESMGGYGRERDFVQMIMENLKTAGVQQAHKEDKITFTSLTSWPGDLICAEGRYIEGNAESGAEKRAAVFIGPEFGTVSRPDLVAAAREAGDADFDVLIACAFNYDAHSSEFDKLGRIPVLKARMNADLHMADDLKNTGKGNLFVIFGEPDIDILDAGDGQIQVKVNGVDVFHPNTGEVRSDGAEGIACWFIDTDYNEESFFVRHAYFLGANDPYKALKTTLKAEINEEAWATLNSDTSRPFAKPKTGRIAVKVINHLGDEVMKVFRV